MAFGATVLNHSITQLSWNLGGEQFEAWSNINFNLVSGISRFEAGGHPYEPEMLLVNVDEANALPHWHQPPRFPDATPQFILSEGDTSVEGAARFLEGLRALYTLVAARKDELTHAYLGREALRLRLNAERAMNPLVPRDVVIQMWPGEGSRDSFQRF